MNLSLVTSLFTLFSGVAELDTLLPLIRATVQEVTAQLRPGADAADERLCFFAAALANLRHSQMLAAQEHLTLTAAGTAPTNETTARPRFAEALMQEYRRAASELLLDPQFCFVGTNG